MRARSGWITALTLSLILLLVLPGLFIIGWNWRNGYGGMMGGAGMMGGFGYLAPLGFFGMMLMWLIPLGSLLLLVTGGIALINNLVKPGGSAAVKPDWRCSNCGKPVQSDWAFCPECGKLLK